MTRTTEYVIGGAVVLGTAAVVLYFYRQHVQAAIVLQQQTSTPVTAPVDVDVSAQDTGGN